MYYEQTIAIIARHEKIFAYLDDHKNLSSHMSNPSWMMGGGNMQTSMDSGKGKLLGSRISLKGSSLGMKLSVDEEITKYKPPYSKEWETINSPSLVVIGKYKMGIEISEGSVKSKLKVYIDYDLPKKNSWLGKLFGKLYAKWCVRQMINGAGEHFKKENS